MAMKTIQQQINQRDQLQRLIAANRRMVDSERELEQHKERRAGKREGHEGCTSCDGWVG